MNTYDNIETAKRTCFRCMHYGYPKVKKGKDKWKGHIFVSCENCSSKVFWSK